ncbi:MAG: ABC transporter ATP-binding protein, partial [Gemmatimonadota bacterium]
VIEAGTVHGLSPEEAERRTHALFAQLELPDPVQLAMRYPHELSGGMRQRVLLAMAMLHCPEVMIADEATTALDPALRHTVLDTLDAMRREHGTTVLLISHDHAVVAARCDRILTMAAGRITSDRPPAPVTSTVERAPTPAARARTPLLVVRDLVVDYAPAGVVRDANASTRAVDGLSLTIDRGEVLGLIGPSGSGKTSVARALMRLTPVTSGTIHLETTNLLTLDARALRRMRRRLQWIPQDAGAALTPHLRVEALVAEGLEVHELARGDDARRQARALLDEVGLPTRAATARPAELSTGERQRVAIARALASRPDLLLCDEPVANLDPARRTQILDLLAELQRARGLSILLISHDESAIERLASRVVSMYLGRSGAPAAP